MYCYGNIGELGGGFMYLLNAMYQVFYRTNVGRVTPLKWLGPIGADWSNLAQQAALFNAASFLMKGWKRWSACLMTGEANTANTVWKLFGYCLDSVWLVGQFLSTV